MKYDIIIIGAGPAGLCFSRALAETGLKIALIEKQPESILSAPPYDGREIALTHSSHKTMGELGMLDKINDNDISLIRDAQVLNGKSPYALHFDHEDAGEENLGFMISNHMIRKAAYESIKEFSNISLMTDKEVSTVETDDKQGRVTLTDGQELTAPLIVAADSRFSQARDMMGIEASKLNFERTCIVCRMDSGLPHDYTAYECFHYDRTLAVLPLNDNAVSVVITLDSKESESVMNMSADDFGSDTARRADERFGDMKLLGKLHSYPLIAVYAKSFYAKRFALIGDAAVGMHPVTAHGFNLGLKGACTLAGEIKAAKHAGSDIGAAAHLRRYHFQHRKDTRPIYLGTNALVKLYTNKSLPARIVRRSLLRLGNRIGPAKRLIMNQLTENNAA